MILAMNDPVPASVHIDAIDTWSGGQVQATGLALGLAERGGRVVWVCPPGAESAARLAKADVRVVTIPMRGQFDVLAVARLHAVLRRHRPEVIHCHSSHAHTLGGIAARLARMPVVATKRTDFPPAHGWLTRWRYGRLVDRVIAISEGVRRAMLSGGVPPQRIVLIHSSVDCDHFHPGISGGPVRRALGIGPGDLVVGMVGQLITRKGHDLLLRAQPDCHVIFCGDGPQADPLRELAASLGMASRVHFLGFREDVRPVLAAVDVLAMPSRLEGLGVAALEAMAMGLPVVASNVGGLAECVVDGETGRLVPVEHVASLARALRETLGDPRLRRRMGEASRRRADQVFGRNAMVERHIALYRGLLAKD